MVTSMVLSASEAVHVAGKANEGFYSYCQGASGNTLRVFFVLESKLCVFEYQTRNATESNDSDV